MPNLTVLYQNINNFINNSIEAKAKNINIALFVRVIVTDDGDGMDEHTLSKVGKVEYTTKHGDISSGNGIALINAQKSTAALGWQMQLHSSLGVGTTITIIIPFK